MLFNLFVKDDIKKNFMDVEDIQYIGVNTPLEIVKKLLPILYDLLYIATILYTN